MLDCAGADNEVSLRSATARWKTNQWQTARWLAETAVHSLLDEANLTPKPALVDSRGPGAHRDMSLDLLQRSANSLGPMFDAIAIRTFEAHADMALREDLGELGRRGEQMMAATTGGVNTHRGAIWTLGLLCAATAMLRWDEREVGRICAQAAVIAALPNSRSLIPATHGERVSREYGVPGARGEALDGFRHIVEIGMPMLRSSRRRGVPEVQARLNVLLAIMAELDDTCLLYRGGMSALTLAKQGARTVLSLGGVSSPEGFRALQDLDRGLLNLGSSPGGSADLLAGVLFLDSVARKSSDIPGGASGNTGV